MHTNIELSLKLNFMGSFFKYAFSSIAPKTLNLHDKSPNTFALHIFGLKCCLHP